MNPDGVMAFLCFIKNHNYMLDFMWIFTKVIGICSNFLNWFVKQVERSWFVSIMKIFSSILKCFIKVVSLLITETYAEGSTSQSIISLSNLCLSTTDLQPGTLLHINFGFEIKCEVFIWDMMNLSAKLQIFGEFTAFF